MYSKDIQTKNTESRKDNTMKKILKPIAIFITTTVLIFSFSSCKNGKDGSSSNNSGDSSGDNSRPGYEVEMEKALEKFERYNKGAEEFSKNDAQLLITRSGAVFFLTSDGEVYGSGKNSNFEMGIGNDYEIKQAIKIPVPEPIEKIDVAGNSIFFFARSGNIYQTGRNYNPSMFNYVEIEGVETPSTFPERHLRKIDVPELGEKIVSIELSSDEGRGYFIVESGKLYSFLDFEEYKSVAISEKIKGVYSSRNEDFFLAESGNLYSLKAEEGSTVKLIANKVSEVKTSGHTVYYISDGTVYGKGEVFDWLPPETSFPMEEDALNTVTFRALNVPEKVVGMTGSGEVQSLYSQPCDTVAFIGESGKVYGIRQKEVTNEGGYTSVSRTIENVYVIDNIEKAVSLSTTDVYKYGGAEDSPKYVCAVKYEGEEWKIGYCSYIDGTVVTQFIPLSETSEWKN